MHADEITEAFANWHRALKKLRRFEEELAQARACATAETLEALSEKEKLLVAECNAAMEHTTELIKLDGKAPKGEDKPD